jgi:hypothetical protein
MDIVYLKLTNGDELFAELVGEEGNMILLADVMVMETIQIEGEHKYLFMSRYNQYSDLHSLSLDKAYVIFIHEASQVTKNHYAISVQYAKQISDNRFREGISEATRYLASILKKDDSRKGMSDKESFETVKDRILGTFETNSNTKH